MDVGQPAYMSKYAFPRGGNVARFAHIHPVMTKTWTVVKVNSDASDTYAAESLRAAVTLANADPDSVLEFGTVEAADAGMARLMRPRKWHRVCQSCAQPMRKVAAGIHDCDTCGYTVVA